MSVMNKNYYNVLRRRLFNNNKCIYKYRYKSSSSSSLEVNLKPELLLNEGKGTYWAECIMNGKRQALSRGITLLESHISEDERIADAMLLDLLEKSPNLNHESHGKLKSLRIGITGPPGAGKSTFIESFGLYLANKLNKKIAVLSIDPSSAQSFGSIMADKTRMNRLSIHKNAFIRPSPSGGILGGVQSSTAESILLCEAYGADVVIVETVGVGQSETHVADMVDVVCMLVSPAGGDEFQGMKKGIIEVADFIIVNKADGDFVSAARHTMSDYSRALALMRHKYTNWKRQVLMCSSLTGSAKQMEDVWTSLHEYIDTVTVKTLLENRQSQRIARFDFQIRERLWREFVRYSKNDDLYNSLLARVKNNKITGRYAAALLTHDFRS